MLLLFCPKICLELSLPVVKDLKYIVSHLSQIKMVQYYNSKIKYSCI